MRRFTAILSLLAVLLVVPYAGADPINVAAIGGNYGNQAANSIIAARGDGSTIARISEATFNSMSVSTLLSSYDVLLFTWNSSGSLNADWNTRLLPYLTGGGGIIWEDDGNLGDLSPVVSAFNGGGNPATVVSVPGLTAAPGIAINTSFVNNHIGFSMSSWDPALSPFLIDGGGTVTGLYGTFGGGRIVLTGPDQDYHANPGDNQYNLLTNELNWVAAGAPIPEPGTLLLLGSGLAAVRAAGRRRRG
jgi:hypothetical protein